MPRTLSRRRVLRSGVLTAAAVGLAGCGGFLGGGESACAAVEAYYTALLTGDVETAVEYRPYEYLAGTSREDALEDLQVRTRGGEPVGSDVDVSCTCSEEFDQEAIDTIGFTLEERVTTLVGVSFRRDVDGQSDTDAAIAYEVDGDGWFVSRFPPVVSGPSC